MRFGDKGNRHIKSILIVALIAALSLIFTGCEDFGLVPASTPTPEAPEVEEVNPSISTVDRAILAVYEHLLGQAETHEAKDYLAEFYAASDNWSAEREQFKDGSSIWYVLADMTANETWERAPYWQQTGWFVLQDGKVMPSYRIQGNAIRIEADLQELSLKSELQLDQGT